MNASGLGKWGRAIAGRRESRTCGGAAEMGVRGQPLGRAVGAGRSGEGARFGGEEPGVCEGGPAGGWGASWSPDRGASGPAQGFGLCGTARRGLGPPLPYERWKSRPQELTSVPRPRAEPAFVPSSGLPDHACVVLGHIRF